MKKKFNVLIVEDHPFIIDIYKNVLSQINKQVALYNYNLTITEAVNSDDALDKINKSVKIDPYDLIFLDIRIPPSKNGKILSGEDLGEIVKSLLPTAKILVITSLDEIFRLNNILNKLNPDGFLIKSDVSFSEITMALKSILDNNPYYSKTILKLIRKQISSGLIIDKIDRQLLFQLSLGTKMKDLPNILPMSMAGIERRKRALKNIFSIPNEEDKVLIEMAKENGFL